MISARVRRILFSVTAAAAVWGLSMKPAQAAPTVDLMWDQAFTSSSDLTVADVEVAPILVTCDAAATITATSEFRVLIPDTYQMVWDTSDTVCEILMSGGGVISPTISSYPTAGVLAAMIGHVCQFDVTTTLNANDRFVITGLEVRQASEDESNAGAFRTLAIAWNNENTTPDGVGDASATQLWTSWRGSMSSASNFSYSSTDTSPTLPSITITEGATAPLRITAGGNIHIRIPNAAAYGTSPTFVVVSPLTITGSAAGKVLTAPSYESGNRGVRIDVTQDFAAGESITISGLKITTPAAAYSCDSLELLLDDGLTTIIATDRRIFTIGPPTCAVSTMTDVAANAASGALAADVVLFTATSGQFSSSSDLRLMIMPNSTGGGGSQGRDNLTWTSGIALTATVSGGTGGAMDPTVNLSTVDTGSSVTQLTGNGRCNVLNVLTSFSDNSQITVSGLKTNNSTAVITRLYIGLIINGLEATDRDAAFGACSALVTDTNTSSATSSGGGSGTLATARGGGGVCFLRSAERSAPQ